ncbi:MAG: MBL fold metallo-hydrolase [Myxococcales bacterium]|nr:MBL fold metallo-hydrolase [Myxococcales bacterium]MDD9966195.1 MBL fold metallo-hydrolase [Myxococcales bacterium]
MSVKTELEEVGEGCFAYLQLPGVWGYSNSGLIRDGDKGLVVDTLYDPRLAAQMLGEYRRIAAGASLETVVNTHANGDHCWGNQLFDDAEIISSEATAGEFRALSPNAMNTLVRICEVSASIGAPALGLLRLLGRLGVPRAAALSKAAPFVAGKFRDFDFGSVTLRPPDRTFCGELELAVGDRRVVLMEVGPAHTRGDVLVFVPDQRVIYTGDILFEESHPIMWEGPIENWLEACDRILALDVETVVPGHGRVTNRTSIQQLKTYLTELRDAARKAYDAGVSVHDAAYELRGKLMPNWGESERLAGNVATLYRQFGDTQAAADPVEMMAQMAHLAGTH